MSHQNRRLIDELVKSRKRSGLSQAAFGEKLSFPQSYISSIENGKRDIRLSNFLQIAKLLNLEVVLVPRQLTPAVNNLILEFTTQQTAELPAFVPTGDGDDDVDET
jgi:HTH-type transcriptional regulator / antitoxin HipB